MKKKTAIRLVVTAGLLILLAVVALIDFNTSPKVTANVTKHIAISDGKCEEDSFEIPFVLEKAGNYWCKVGFWPDEDPGFLTGFYINDKDGNVIWGATAQKLTMESKVQFLEKGEYKVVFEFITNNEQFKEFYDEHRLSDYEYTDWYGFKDSDMIMNYDFAVVRDINNVLPIVAILCGALGISLAAILCISLVKGNRVKFEYDERMLLSRYKSEERALGVMTFGMVIIFLLSAAEVDYAFGAGLQVFTVLIMGVSVAAIDSILHDGFFAMNYNKKGYIIFEVIICVLCLLATAFFAWKKMFYVNGKVTSCAVFPIVSAMQVAIFTALIIKRKKDSTED